MYFARHLYAAWDIQVVLELNNSERPQHLVASSVADKVQKALGVPVLVSTF